MEIPEKLLPLYYSSPLVHTCLQFWIEGNISFEDALILTIHTLSEQQEELKNILFNHLLGSPGQNILFSLIKEIEFQKSLNIRLQNIENQRVEIK